MAEIIRMPRMSDTMEEGVIVGWQKQVGDAVEPGDVLAEVETDKATMELESFQEGVLLYIGVKEGPVPVNGLLAVIGEEGEDYKEALAQADQGAPAEAAPAEAAAETATETPVAETASANGTSNDRIKASPLARSIAEKAGINLSSIQGSGDQGRIVKRDVEAFIQDAPASAPAAPVQAPAAPVSSPAVAPAAPAPAAPAAPVVQPFVHGGTGDNYEDIPASQMRKVIARRLGESKFSAPHFYLTIEVNMDKTIATRKQLNEIAPVKISFNDLVIKSVAAALRQHPAINSSWLEDRIRRNGDVNIGVAVAVDEGLMVPVIRHADMKSLSQINTEVKALAGKARDRKLQPQEMQGNTFTISNLGMFDIDEFTAIINPPDACILAVGSIVKKPIVKNDELVIGNIMKLTLSCDHRVVDGATGAKFLQTLKKIMEDPMRILV